MDLRQGRFGLLEKLELPESKCDGDDKQTLLWMPLDAIERAVEMHRCRSSFAILLSRRRWREVMLWLLLAARDCTSYKSSTVLPNWH